MNLLGSEGFVRRQDAMRLRSAAFFALVVARPARASCWGEHIGGSAGVQGNGVPAGGARLGRVRARRAGPRGAAMPQSQPWQALAFCWPSSTGQGCAKVSDYRFIDIKLINYVPYVPIVIARAEYEVYAQMIICQNSIALTLKVVRLRFSAWTALRSARWVAS